MPLVEERVSDLEHIVAQLATAQLRTETSLTVLSAEMREFKDEMREFKDEMAEFKNEMGEFKDEMREFKVEAEADRKRMNKAWGDLANRLGTIIEDIVLPNVRRLATDEFGFVQIDDVLVRARRRSRRGADRQREYDVICTGPGRVIVAESKTNASREYVEAFAGNLREFFDFFPEYESMEFIGVFASWSLAPELCERISQLGLYGVAMGEETMQIVARPAA